MSTSGNDVIGVFENHTAAEDAVRKLQREGFDMRQLSIIGKGYHTTDHVVGFYTTGDRLKSWGGIGAFWGGIWGLFLGGAFFWVPGIGPLALAGPLVQMLVTALEGAAVVGGAGVLAGALASIGISKDKALKYQSDIGADRFVLIAHGDAKQIEHARELLQRADATAVAAAAA